MADLTSKIKLLIQSQDGANQDAKLFPILPIPATVGDALTCSRALNTATRVNSAGLIETVAANMPRITWERGVDQCPNLLVEKSRANLFPYSEDFTNASWGKIGGATVTANQIISPDGTLNADMITEGTSVLVYYSALLPAGTYTQSYYAKKGTSDIFGMYFGGSFTASFNLTLGTIISQNNTFAQIQDVGNGWFRCTATATIGTDFYGGININTADGSTFYVWGADIKTGSLLTSYIPTGAVAVTANADNISKTGIGTLLAGAKGLFVDCYLQAGSLAGENVNRRVVSLSTGGGSNAIAIGRYEGIIRVIANNSGIDITDILITTPFKNKRIKVFVAFDIVANTLKMYVNGALVKSLTSFTAYTPSTVIDVGGFNGVNQWDGLIKAVAVTDEFTEADIEQISSYPSFANMAEQMMYEMV
jgi:hypothetical protein